MTKPHKRRLFLDHWRGFAVIHMAFFHFSYDLMTFNLWDIDTKKDLEWWVQPRIIVTFFMLAVGSSLVYAHRPHIRWRSFWQRWLKIAAGAVFITAFTFFVFPEHWVYFGTLHSIATCSLLTLPFLRVPKLALTTGIGVLLPHFFGLWQWPFWKLPHSSMDYIPPLPWVGFALIGVFLAHFDFWGKITARLSETHLKYLKPLEFCGRHALKIYLLHQPILFSTVWALSQAIKVVQ